MDSATFVITGDVSVQVTVTEQPDGTLLFELQVMEDAGTTGDLRGIFFDISDDSLAGSLVVSGTEVTDAVASADSITKTSKDNNVNGEVVNEAGKFDVGVEFGTSGMAGDDIQTASFTLALDSGEPLTLDQILSQDFAVRLTSTGDIDGSRDGSLKLGGTAPDQPDDDGGGDVLDILGGEEFEFEDPAGDPPADDPMMEDPVVTEDPSVDDPVVDDPIVDDPVVVDPPVYEDLG